MTRFTKQEVNELNDTISKFLAKLDQTIDESDDDAEFEILRDIMREGERFQSKLEVIL